MMDKRERLIHLRSGEQPMETRTTRIARKRHRCVNAGAAERGNPLVVDLCTRSIEPGQPYVEGERDPHYAGGFGRDRICVPCADGGHA